jgi:hypothetical protein
MRIATTRSTRVRDAGLRLSACPYSQLHGIDIAGASAPTAVVASVFPLWGGT